MIIAASLFSFTLCIFLAVYLAKHKSFSFLIDRSSRFQTLDGLRGFLALSVLFHHYIITYYWKLNGQWVRPPEDYYQNYGKVGVAIFFMITGFLFISKILNQKTDINWLKIYESRFFRIIPLYIFALVLITLVVFDSTNYQLNDSFPALIKQYIKWGIFHGGSINGFADTKHVIAGVDWTLKYEWFFYLALPMISIVILGTGKFVILMILLIVFALYIEPSQIYSFSTQYFILFAFGGLVSYAVKKSNISEELIDSRWMSLVTLFLFFASIFYPRTLDLIHHLIMALFFMLVVFGNSIFGLLRFRSTVLLGEISYSIYLLHGVVLYLIFTQFRFIEISKIQLEEYMLMMPLVSIVVVLVSAITFLFIELPFMHMGRKYIFTKWITKLAGIRKVKVL
jgi:peptidoglycan/LPS O-acetylase OafA/YrhL